MKDLTKIKTPFGLLKPKVRSAMHEHHDAGGTIQCYSVHGWMDCEPDWTEYRVYRVKPADLIMDARFVPAIPWDNGVKPRSVRDEIEPPHPIFAAVKEWQEARLHYQVGEDYGGLWAAAQALAEIKVPS